ncbi:MAG: transcription antitermination factor NusB [Kosmotogaceae bacterium]
MIQDARSIALQTLSFFDANGYISFKKVEIALSTLSSKDRSFCINLIYGVLRKRIRIDYELARFLRKPSKVPVAVRNVLRMGVFQIQFLDSVPEYASIDSSVNLVGVKEFRNLVNAVLRKIADSGPSREQPFNVTYSHPEWLVNYWRDVEWIENLEELLEYNQTPPVQTVIASGREDELVRKGFVFDRSQYSDLINVFQRGDSMDKLENVDEVEYILSGVGVPVAKHSGSLTGRINSMPWLFHSLGLNAFTAAFQKAKELLRSYSKEHDDFIYYSQAMTVEENKKALDSLSDFQPVEMEEFFTRLGIASKFDGSGYWLQPWKAPLVSYVARLRRAR